jgi:hypothetical protein
MMKAPGRTDGFRGWVVGLFLLGAVPAAAQPPIPSGELILKHVEEGLASLTDYTVTLEVTADIERLNVPPMKVRMFFKKPDRVHFDARGFALLPRDGLAFSVGRLTSKYNVVRVDREELDSVAMYRVTLLAKSERARPRSVLLYVHPGRWTPEKLVTPQTGDRLMSARFRYTKVDGFWLPEELVASFSFAAPDSGDPNLFEQFTPPRQQQKPRSGSVTVRYSGYRVNTGLSDDLFQERPPGGLPE